MINMQEITKKLETMSHDELMIISAFVEFIKKRAKQSSKLTEMNDSDVIFAAEQTGSFDFLKESSEDIYTLEDGEPL